MYKYTGKRQVMAMVNGKAVGLGISEAVEINPAPPKTPFKIYPASQKDLEILSKTLKEVIYVKSKKSDTTGSPRSEKVKGQD